MSEGSRKRRCIIKKLDFENCIVTSSATKGSGRKKLRARLTRETEEWEAAGTAEPPEPHPTSPVLMRGAGGGRKSPVLFCRRKINLGKEGGGEGSVATPGVRSPSPVFTPVRRKRRNEGKEPSREGGLRGEGVSSGVESYVIEEAVSQESRVSVGISSVGSSGVGSGESGAVGGEGSAGEGAGGRGGVEEQGEAGRVRKWRRKRNSLLDRLRRLQNKQASEKLLWQHRNSKNSSSSLRLSVLALWRSGFHFFLKCCSLPPEPSVTFLVVDSRWVPQLKSVKPSSVLQLHPPWQKLTVEESGETVLVNVTCLDVLEGGESAVAEERTFGKVAVGQSETLEKLFVDSICCSNSCGFM